MLRVLAASVIGVTSWAAWVVAEVVTLEKPLSVTVQLRDPPRAPPVAGQLIWYDDETLMIQTRKGEERTLQWVELSPGSAYTLRYRLIDKNSAQDWLTLGEFAWGIGANQQAEAALKMATKLDAALREQADEILKGEPGSLIESSGLGDDEGLGEAWKKARPKLRTDKEAAAPKYRKSTPQEDQAAHEAARRRRTEVERELDLVLKEVQCEHFLIFTDWEPSGQQFIKRHLEAAYVAVSKQFEIPAKETIFVGKLPVFMFEKQDDFLRFSGAVDGFRAPQTAAGYYLARSDGAGHMAMWKPDVKAHGGNVQSAERAWAYVLTHELTHAFVARYHGDGRVPTWLNEGMAEVVASSLFPRTDTRIRARQMASRSRSIAEVFEREHLSAEWYPVMQTLVETLMLRDRKAFLPFFYAIKNGQSDRDALEEFYGWDHETLEQVWRKYVQR